MVDGGLGGCVGVRGELIRDDGDADVSRIWEFPNTWVDRRFLAFTRPFFHHFGLGEGGVTQVCSCVLDVCIEDAGECLMTVGLGAGSGIELWIDTSVPER